MNDHLVEAVLDSFDCEVVIEWDYGSNKCVAAFVIAGRSGVVTFSSIKTALQTWSVAFDFQRPSSVRPEVAAVCEDIRLYGCLFQVVREFIKDRQATTVVFVSEDEGLSCIYQAYLRRGDSSMKSLS